MRKRIKKAQQLGRHLGAAKCNSAAKTSKTQHRDSDFQFKALLAQLTGTQALPAEQQAVGDAGAETDQRLLPPAPDTEKSVKVLAPAGATHSRSNLAGQWSLDLRNIAMD